MWKKISIKWTCRRLHIHQCVLSQQENTHVPGHQVLFDVSIRGPRYALHTKDPRPHTCTCRCMTGPTQTPYGGGVSTRMTMVKAIATGFVSRLTANSQYKDKSH